MLFQQFVIFRTRLTAVKEKGASIEIEGEKVVLGIPGAQARDSGSVTAYSDIPLCRGATPDEAAAAMLLWVASVIVHFSFLMRLSASHRHWHPT